MELSYKRGRPLDEDKRIENALLVMTGKLAQFYTSVQLAGPESPGPAMLQAAIAFFGVDEQPELLVADESDLTSLDVAEGIQQLELPGLAQPAKVGFINVAGVSNRREEEAAIIAAATQLKDPDLPVGVVAVLHNTGGEVVQRLWFPRFFTPVVLWRAMRTVAREAFLS